MLFRSVAVATGDLNLGIHALAVPLFDHDCSLVGALSVFGGQGLLDISVEGAVATSLKDRALIVSRQLGCS